MSDIRDVVIIGSGPAGYTAALYTARAQLKPLPFGSSIFVGGSLTTTAEVENFSGCPEGVDGPVVREHVGPAEMIDDDIVSVDLAGDVKLLTDSAGTVHRARTVIIAIGSGYRNLSLPNEDALSGRGVSWCATCDGFFFRDRDIVVVGGGDTAMEEATFLIRFARSVTVVHHRAPPCAPPRSCRTGPSPTTRSPSPSPARSSRSRRRTACVNEGSANCHGIFAAAVKAAGRSPRRVTMSAQQERVRGSWE